MHDIVLVLPEELIETEFPTVTPKERISKVIELAKEYNVSTIPVVDDHGRLVGTVTYKDLLERRVSPLSKVKAVMSGPHKVTPDTDIKIVAYRFYTLRMKNLPVVDKDNKVIGIIRREPFAKYLVDEGYVKPGPVKDYASTPAVTANVNDPVAKVKWEMLRRGISRMPILDEGKLVGIVTMRDIIERLYYASIPERQTLGEVAGSEDEILAAPVKAIMTYPVVTAQEKEDVSAVLRRLIERGISGLPVMKGDQIYGVFSGLDIIRRFLQGEKVVIPIPAKIEFELPEDKWKLLEKIVSHYYGKLNRLTNIIDIKMTVKVYECIEEQENVEKRCKYSVHIKLKDPYDEYVVTVTDWDPIKAVRDALHLLFRNIVRVHKKLKKALRKRGISPRYETEWGGPEEV